MGASRRLLASIVGIVATACADEGRGAGRHPPSIWDSGKVGLYAGVGDEATAGATLVVWFELSPEIRDLGAEACEALDAVGGTTSGTERPAPRQDPDSLTRPGYAGGDCGFEPIEVPFTGQDVVVWLAGGGRRASLRVLLPASPLATPEGTVELVGTAPTAVAMTTDPAYTLTWAEASFYPAGEAWYRERLTSTVAGANVYLSVGERAPGCEMGPCRGPLTMDVHWAFAEVDCEGFIPCEVRGSEYRGVGELVWTEASPP